MFFFFKKRFNSQIQKEFARVIEEGWLPFFIEAAENEGEKVEHLLGIASRETNMGGRKLSNGKFEWLEKLGDNGNGFGLMQADKRSYPNWIASGEWKDARKSILMGALVLAEKRSGIVDRAGKTCKVQDSKSKQWYSFVMPQLKGDRLEEAAIASYNGGNWPLYHSTKGRAFDYGTTGRDYSKDVLTRAKEFRRLLDEYEATQAQASTEETAANAEAPASEEAAPAQALVAPANLKSAGVSFFKMLAGGYKRVTGWLVSIGVALDAGIFANYPWIILVLVILLIAGFAVFYCKNKKKAKK